MAAQARGKLPSRPLGVTLLALFQFVTGVSMIGSSFWSFGISSWVKTAEGQDWLTSEPSPLTAQGASGLFFIIGIVYLVLGASALWLSRGYIKGYERARRYGRHVASWGIALVFLGLLVLPAWEKNQGPLGTILFNLVIIFYLGRPKIRAYFRAHSR